ncbi:MAG TPA: restriction endonuclease [Clostridia bacterium]|nr:restriction endonuclease [Clostridia bacterium]
MSFNSREYRNKLGFTNQATLKKYFKATDIISINWDKIKKYNQRLKNIFMGINCAVHEDIRLSDVSTIDAIVDDAYQILSSSNIISRLNNYGRTPEDVYYSWMRGYVVCKYFSKALSLVFNIPQEEIRSVGQDQLTNIGTFSQSPIADLEITVDDKIIRLEVQSGFTGANDIKRHKVQEARRIFNQSCTYSYVIHFDLFNGAVAIIDISNIEDDNMNWEHRSQFEDQVVFAIPGNAFKWFLPNPPPSYSDILF